MFAVLSVKMENVFLADVFDGLGNRTFLCILGSRMLFNLKEAGERGQNEGTSYNASSRTVSEMEFAQEGPVNSEGDYFLFSRVLKEG